MLNVKPYYTFEDFLKALKKPSPIVRLTIRSMLKDGDIYQGYIVKCPSCNSDILIYNPNQFVSCDNLPTCSNFVPERISTRVVYVPK